MHSLSQYYDPSTIPDLQAFTKKQFENNNISVDFPENLENLTEKKLSFEYCSNRIDLRNIPCFTIDCENTQDMDDAISLTKTRSGYMLGVHIADVGNYIAAYSALDREAYHRGTSIYLPHMTIPMLPEVLSNNCCSLNPNMDRNGLSVLISLDGNARVESYKITKSIIRSRLKGCYSEINELFGLCYSSAIAEKYSTVAESLFNMKKIADKLREDRARCGARIFDKMEPNISIVNGVIELVPQKKGIAESIVEEYMVLANRLVSEYFVTNNLPVIFRAQEIKKTLAKYTTTPCQHADLAMEHYLHFTSPIRRLADLKIHQILTLHLNGVSNEDIDKLFRESLINAAEQARKRKNRADNIQNACKKFCYSEFFSAHPEESFAGKVIGLDPRRNCTIIDLNYYHVRILAAASLKVYEGLQVSFKVWVDRLNEKLMAVEVKHLASSAA